MKTFCFLHASRANYFMTELLGSVAAAAQRSGVPIQSASDRFPDLTDDAVYVVIPHEFMQLAPNSGGHTPRHLERTIGLCVEQPGTPEFEITCMYAAQLGAVLTIHEGARREFVRRGIPAIYFPLGYIPDWDCWRGVEGPRPLDVLYLGSCEARRGCLLASYGPTLWKRKSRLVLARFEPKPGPEPSFVVGSEKYELLRSSRVILNLHREGAQGLEWMRVLEAICNGAVVVSEHSSDCSPLVAGEHYLSGPADGLALIADGLLDDDERLSELRAAAYELVRTELPIERSIERLVSVGEGLPATPPAPQSAGLAPPGNGGFAGLVGNAVREELGPLRAALKGLHVEMLRLGRDLSRLEQSAMFADDTLELAVLAETEAYAQLRPRVSVAISLFNYQLEIVEALASVAASDHDSYEVLILDDASTDGSVDAVLAFLAERPWFAARLMRHRSNLGVSRSRNALFAEARGELVFVLDADNAVYPPALSRLEEALVQAPDASFAFAVSGVWQDGEPVGLLSAREWDPSSLRYENYIDAAALVRRDRFIELGGYCEDPRLTGMEDYDLWCRFADAGQHGAHVPEIMSVYRRKAHGLLESIAKIDSSVGRSLIKARAPRLFSPTVDEPLVATAELAPADQ